MWAPAFTLALVVGASALSLAACSPTPPEDSPTPIPSPAPTGDVFTTEDGVRFSVEVVASNLQIPWSLAFAPDGRLFVTERPGRVRIFNLQAGTSELALTLDDAFTQGEAGVLGLTLDPEFASNGFVYVYYTARAGGGAVNRVVRHREVAGRLGEPAVLLDGIPANAIHDGGRLRFGPDGLLYVTTGDAANASLAQDLGSVAGKILRVNRDGTTPGDNPFTSPVYTYGHRNPQGLDWHPAGGSLWAAEHGNSGNDEVNVIEAGVNYGWPRIEGSQSMPGMRTPVVFYSPAVAPSGASFYRGSRFPAFVNNLFVATLRGTHILRLRIDPGSSRVAAQERLLNDRYGRIRDVVAGPDGLLYFCTSNRDGRGSPVSADDRIARLVPAP
ncbi:MAG: PQQ-dependent sugar dehydrogenase [Vicinamibacterales bacterium]